METKILKSINLIRRGSGARLNLFRYTAMVIMLQILGIGNAWGGSDYYTKVTLSKNPSAAGKVYAQKGVTTGTWTENGTTSAKDNQSSAPTHTWYIKAEPANGYAFVNWTDMSGWINGKSPSATANPANGQITGNTTAANAEGKAKANFAEITINAGSSTTPVVFENNSVSCIDNTGTITFPTNGDATTDFAAPTFVNTGHGTFSVTTWEVNASTGVVTINYKFVGDNTYGGASGTRSRSTTGVVTLKTCVGNNSNTCTVTASFPNIVISEGSGEDMYTTNGEPKSASASFPVQWADDELDFTASFSSETNGGTWTVDDIAYENGIVTVDYTFNNGRAADAAGVVNHSAVLTLRANDNNAGGATNTVTLNAESKKAASGDAIVINGTSETEYSTLAEAINAANLLNTNPTIRLQRNVTGLSSALEIKKPMTIDLNSFTVSGTLTSSVNKLFYLNTDNAVLTINDSRNGGKISATGDNNAILYTVLVDKGSLVLTKGDIEMNNTNTGGTAKANAVRIKAGARFAMAGGNLTATTAGSYAYGLFVTTNPSDANMIAVSGGTITATAAQTLGIGVYCQSSSATPAADPTKANVLLDGVTVNASTTGTTDAYAVQTDAGVILGINSGSYNATAATTKARALLTKGYTAVVNGTFNAVSGATDANAIRVEAGIAAVRNGAFFATAQTHAANTGVVASGAKLLTYGGTFHGKLENVAKDKNATGVYVNGTLEAQGGTFIGEAANSGLAAAQTSLAVGVYANTGSNVTLANATLRGLTDNTYVNGSYGLYTLTTNAVNLTNCTLEVSGQYQYGYGIRNNGTPLSVKNSEITVNTQYAYNYGIYQEGNTTTDVENTTITCEANSVRAHAIWVNNGQVNATNCSLTAKTKQATATAEAESNLRAVYVNTGKKVSLNGCTVTAKGNANYSQNGYGLYIDGSADIDNTTVTVSDVKTNAYAIGNTANTTLVAISSGKFSATAASGTIVSTNGTAAAAKQQLYGGYYKQNTNLAKYLPTGYGIETLPTSAAEYAEGYRYAIRPTTAVGDPVCKIGAVGYTTLEEALEYASKNATSSNKLVILMVKDYTLKAGDYILPAYTTLLVPYKSDQTTAIGTTPSRASGYATRSPYRTLTFASGAKMTVYGTIEASAQQNSTDQTSSGEVRGPFGYIKLSENSSVTLENGASLIAWGFVCGKGTITVKNGAKAYEMMSLGYYKGGNTTSTLYSNSGYKVFVITDYAYQNIECPITYHPGAQALGAAATEYFKPNDIVLVGTTNTSFFKMVAEEASADTWVRKEYDPKTDYTTWTMNNGASMSAIKLDDYSSEAFYLPITSNFRIIMNYGEMNLGGDIEFHPGAELIIKKEATGKVASGKTVVFYDGEDWCTGLGSSSKYYYPVTYSPSWKAATNATTNPRLAKYKQTSSSTATEYLPDAALFIQGKLEVSGYLYTTGDGNKATANRNSHIYSSNDDAGQIIYKTTAPTSTKTMYKCTHIYGLSDWGKGITDMLAGGNSTAYPAFLQNVDGKYETTGGTAANSSWIYKNDHWVMVTTEGCFSVEQISGVKHYYAYPAGFVEVSSNTEDPTTHLFYDAATGERAFLKEADCTWWEVEPTPYDGNKYKCVNPDHNGKYKYYEYVGGQWQEAVVTVTWKNGDATIATYSSTLYGTRPKYLNPSPTRDKTAGEYYTWLGWTKGSENGEFFAKDAELPVATENTTYYAYFETHKFEYTITFKNYDEAVLEAKRWAHGEVPTYEGTPLKPATAAKEYTHDGWSTSKNGSAAAIPAATAAATYYAHFAESDRKYTVQWVNYNGTVLKEEQVAYNTTPSAPTKPTRPNDSYYTYTFDAWSPAVSAVTGNQTYTATYNYEKMVTKYTVTFKNGSTTIYTQNLVANSVPVFDGTTPTKDPTAQYSYTFDGWSTTNGGALAYDKDAELPALTGDVTYYAYFATSTNNYRIIWKSENGKVTLETDPTVPYGTTPSFDGVKPTKDRMGATVYTFDGWSSAIGGAKIALPSVTGNATYYAHFSDDPVYTVTFNANGHSTAPEAQEVVRGQKVTEPVAPTAEGYLFGGWYKEETCTNAWDFNSDVVNANTTLFAKWTPKEYDITYLDKDGAAFSGVHGSGYPKKHTYGTATNLVNPTKEGYNFDGWFTASACTGSAVATLGAMAYTADITLYAKWTPNTNTAYTVKHYQQNLDGTYSSTPTETQNLTGTTGASVTPARKSYEGFEAPAGQTVTILADGSRVVTYYYTRKSYNLSWVTDGDELTGDYTNGSTKFGAAITAPNTPTKTGYTFAGWSPAKAETMPAVATEYTATWTINQYTLTVLSAGEAMGTVTGGGTYDYNTAHTITATPNTGFKFVKWNDDNTENPRSVTIPAENVTYTATFNYDIANYTVKHWQQNINDDGYTEVVTDRQTNLSGTIGTTTTAEAKEYTGFDAQPFSQQTIEVSGTVVNIYYNRNTYTITWVDGDENTIKTDEEVKYGATPSYTGETPTKSNSETQSFVFNNTWSPAVTAVTDNAIYTAQFKAYDLDLHVTELEQNTINEDVTITTTTVENGGTLTVGNENNEVTLQSNTIIVESGGQLDVAEGGSINANVFIIQATTEDQGEDDAKEEVQVSGELSETGFKNLNTIYYDLTRKHGTENFLARVWYAVAVPWAVEVPTYNNGGVYIKQGEEFVQQRLGATFDLITYDGYCRATQGASADCWVYLEDEIDGGADAVMVPGKLYMIYLTQETSTIRFEKKAGVDYPIHTNSLTVSACGGSGNDANWNGIANPATYRAYMNVAVEDGGLVQKFVPGTQPRDGGRYLPIDLNDKQSVGQPFFVQVASTTASTIQVTRKNNSSASAPRRVQAQSDPEVRYAISIAANGKLADRLYIQTAEEKEDEYIIGKDMSKMSVSSRVAQIWVNRYDSKLCLNTAVLDRDKASYPLGIYAPQAGEYKIFAPADIETNDNIYLTLDGRVIWNLTMAPYYASLEQGTTNRYGLKLVRSNAPAVSTDVENLKDGTYPAAQKIIIEDKVYILRGEKLYTITGQLVQ